MSLRVASTACYLPSASIALEQWSDATAGPAGRGAGPGEGHAEVAPFTGLVDLARFVEATGVRRVVAGERESASDMAVLAARKCLELGSPAPRALDLILLCYSVPDEAVASSTACRLQYELAQPGAFPFALGQQNDIVAFTAFAVAQAMLCSERELSTALLVAADRWLEPRHRRMGDITIAGDAAGAILMERSDAPGLRLVEVRTRHAECALGAPGTALRWNVDEVAASIVLLAHELLVDLGWAEASLRWVVAHNLNAVLTSRVHAALRAARACTIENGAADGYLASADPIVSLHRLLGQGGLVSGDRVLMWGASIHMEVACALFEVRP